MSVTIVFVVLVYLVVSVAFAHGSRGATPFVPLMSFVHFAAALFIVISLRSDFSTTDSRLYFYDTENYMLQSWNTGTAFVVRLTVYLSDLLGAGFEDTMFLYSLSGLLGAQLLLFKQQQYLEYAAAPLFAVALLLLPGLHFWTSPIGKDGICFLGLALIAWYSRDYRRDWPLALLGLVMVTLVRPHIGFLTIGAFGLAQVFGAGGQARLGLVIPLLIVGLVGARFVFIPLIDVDIFNPDQVGLFFSSRTDFLMNTTTVRVQYISNPALRVLGFMFLPLVDFGGLLAIAASIENVVLLAITARLVLVLRRVDFLRDDHARFLLIGFLMILLFVGLGNYNVGLGLRQKTMVYPFFSALLTIGEAAARRRRLSTAPDAGTATSVLA